MSHGHRAVGEARAACRRPLPSRMSRLLRELALDTSHFQGQGWSRGLTCATHPSVEQRMRKREFPDEAVFVANGPLIGGPRLVRRLLAKGWAYSCSICDISEWRGV